ncbi:MAG: peptidase C15 [Leptolyngbya sp. Prado105]|jgi:pyroglutamyl-peptidase|nr:peptidase C15 [Leptolyngbya sp. Prado105]
MKILLTSFSTWLDHQTSNSSDDLLDAIAYRQDCHFVRSIPVDFELAPKVTIKKIQEIQPDAIICCGMAESRELLSIESNGRFQSEILRSAFAVPGATRLALESLLEGTTTSEISHDAGNYVCNYLYYCVLKYLERHQLTQPCVFIHVPVLTPDNLDAIVADFLMILDRITHALPTSFPNQPTP